MSEKRCECAACGERFVSWRYFDRHRVGRFEPDERRCLGAVEMGERKMYQKANGVWGGPPMDETVLSRRTRSS